MPNPDYRWDDLRHFLAVWREGNFTAAAEKLGVKQSTVSRRIAALEDALGGVLFDRTSAGPLATDLARRLLPGAERAEGEAQGVLETSLGHAGHVEGLVRIASVESFTAQVLVPELLPGLLQAHPRLRVDLVTSEGTAELARREADLALRFYRPPGGDLIAKRLAVLPTAFLAHPDHLEGRAADALDWVVLSLPGGVGPDEQFVGAHVDRPPRLRCTGHFSQVEAVRAGLGVAVLTRLLLRIAPELVEVQLDLPSPPPVELWMVTPRSLRHVPRVDAAWTWMEQRLPALLASPSG